jgi:hypothetical protein
LGNVSTLRLLSAGKTVTASLNGDVFSVTVDDNTGHGDTFGEALNAALAAQQQHYGQAAA